MPTASRGFTLRLSGLSGAGKSTIAGRFDAEHIGVFEPFEPPPAPGVDIMTYLERAGYRASEVPA